MPRSRAGFISHWQGIFEVPPPVVDAIQKETAETVLRKLIEQNDPRYAPAAYILAVMLERKRILKVKEQIIRDGQRVFIYEQPKTGDIFTIADPNLHLDQLEEVQRDVAMLLEQGLNPRCAPAAEIETAPPVEQPAGELNSVSDFAALQNRLGCQFRDENLLRLALTHPVRRARKRRGDRAQSAAGISRRRGAATRPHAKALRTISRRSMKVC